MKNKKNKVLSIGVSLFLLLTVLSGMVAAADYRNSAIGVIGNLSSDFGKLFMEDMPDLVIGALVLGMIIFFGIVLRRIMKKSTD